MLKNAISFLKIYGFCLGWGLLTSLYYFRFIYVKEVFASGLGLLLRAPFAFSFILIEMAVLAFVLVLFNTPGWLTHVLRLGLVALVLTIETMQFYSLYYSNDFMEAGVMAHAALALLLVNAFTVATLFLMLLCGFMLYWRIDIRMQRFRFGSRTHVLWCGVGLVICVLLMVANKHIVLIQETKTAYRAGSESGVASLFKMAFGFNAQMNEQTPEVVLNDRDLAAAKQLGIVIDPAQRYPLVKAQLHEGQSQLRQVDAKPNVIVLFVESLSADFVGVYQKRWQDVTPHINRFADDALVIDQYHNHVTPTIVGLRGQLCSTYPSISHTVWARAKFKLSSGVMQCLPHVLNQHGYETTYMGYAQPNETFFKDQMEEMGFARTYFYHDFTKNFVDGEEPGLGLKGNSDAQMFKGLRAFLETQDHTKPFFIGLSTVETHPGMDIDDPSKRFGDGKSAILNVVHNFDREFGAFWDYFRSSKYAENTVLVLTADHSHTPSVELKDVASERYIDDVFNETTMILYGKHRLPKGRRAIPTTSIDIAPTVLDIVGINQVQNTFLGQSLFVAPRSAAAGLAFQGRLFLVESDGTRTLKRTALEACDKPSADAKVCPIYRVIRYTQYLTEQGRLWPRTVSQ